MRNFQDTFETRKRSFISPFSICMTVSLSKYIHIEKVLKTICRVLRSDFTNNHKKCFAK